MAGSISLLSSFHIAYRHGHFAKTQKLTALKGDRADLHVHWVFLETHLTGHQTVDLGAVSDGVVPVNGQGRVDCG